MFSALFKFFAVIELLDKWADRAFKSYREWKREQERIEMEKSAVDAHKTGSISRLRDRNNRENG